jgi:hypothetical protein
MADIWKQIITAIEQEKPELRQLVPLYTMSLIVSKLMDKEFL